MNEPETLEDPHNPPEYAPEELPPDRTVQGSSLNPVEEPAQNAPTPTDGPSQESPSSYPPPSHTQGSILPTDSMSMRRPLFNDREKALKEIEELAKNWWYFRKLFCCELFTAMKVITWIDLGDYLLYTLGVIIILSRRGGIYIFPGNLKYLILLSWIPHILRGIIAPIILLNKYEKNTCKMYTPYRIISGIVIVFLSIIIGLSASSFHGELTGVMLANILIYTLFYLTLDLYLSMGVKSYALTPTVPAEEPKPRGVVAHAQPVETGGYYGAQPLGMVNAGTGNYGGYGGQGYGGRYQGQGYGGQGGYIQHTQHMQHMQPTAQPMYMVRSEGVGMGGPWYGNQGYNTQNYNTPDNYNPHNNQGVVPVGETVFEPALGGDIGAEQPTRIMDDSFTPMQGGDNRGGSSK